ncbi:MAG TPA: DHA2 family efflux MFS transporter permease subunit [Gemmatimonadales bacterium]|jgi:DHA2 family multidrug resistance protein|nr:DHA2 family efflux MFS transporter permease subunit [Gemmatimonadales bacterium]
MAQRTGHRQSGHQAHRASRRGSGDGYKWRVLGCVTFGIFMVILDTTVVNVAFPTIRQQFHASLSASQWVVSLYVLCLGMSTPLAGYLSDRFGIKKIYLGALGLFTLGSLLSGLAPSLPALMISRGLQGAGGGLALPLGLAMLFAAFPPEEQGVALGIYGIALLFAPALGPILGGLLVDHGVWRWIFFINIPFGATGITLGSILLREKVAQGTVRLDKLGLLFSVIGFGATLYGASVAADSGWTSPPVLVSFGAGIAALAAFIVIDMRVAKDPLLDFPLFGNRIFLNASVVGYVSVVALFGAEFLLPIYLQSLRGLTAFHTGLVLLPLAIAAGIITPLAGRLYDHIGPRILVVAGFAVLCVNTWQLSKLTGDTSMGHIRFLMALRGIALGLTVQSTYTTALGTVDRQRIARGSALINSMRFVVQSLAVALLATILATAQSPRVRQLQNSPPQGQSNQPHARPAPLALCGSAGGDASNGGGGKAAAIPAALRAEGCRESLKGFEHAYRFTFYMAIVALLLGVWLPGWPFEWGGRKRLRAAAT